MTRWEKIKAWFNPGAQEIKEIIERVEERATHCNLSMLQIDGNLRFERMTLDEKVFKLEPPLELKMGEWTMLRGTADAKTGDKIALQRDEQLLIATLEEVPGEK